jgi:branched-chain amino acid transport system permease protein
MSGGQAAARPGSFAKAGATGRSSTGGVTLLRIIGVIVALGALAYLPFILQTRSAFGVRLSNMQLLNVGLAQVNLTLIAIIGAVSLNFLTGCAGLVSIGHAAFFALGGMAAAAAGLHLGLPFLATLVIATGAGAFAGILAGLPSLRVRGLYFVLSTMAVHFIVIFIFSEYQYAFHDVVGITLPDAKIGSFELDSGIRWYFVLLPVVFAVCLMLGNTLRLREGRAMLAMRDNELAAAAVGIDVRVLRLKAFAFSSAIASLAGALQGYFLTTIAADNYTINFAIQFIAMIIIGGMGSITGSILGAIVWLLLPSLLGGLAQELKGSTNMLAILIVDHRPQLVNLVFGLLVILLLIFAPQGMMSAGRKIRKALRGWLARGAA